MNGLSQAESRTNRMFLEENRCQMNEFLNLIQKKVF